MRVAARGSTWDREDNIPSVVPFCCGASAARVQQNREKCTLLLSLMHSCGLPSTAVLTAGAAALQMPLTEEEIYQLYKHLALPYHPPCVVNFMQSLLREDGMIDAFAATCSRSGSICGSAPSWVGAFTAWDQYTNRRYANEARTVLRVAVSLLLY